MPASVTHWRAAELIAEADFVISTPDHDSARLAADWLALLYLKPLLDVGVGVLRQGNSCEAGADIRLIWPGRCLLCAGGVRTESEARRVLASAEAERLLRLSPIHWRQQRAGSLASLNAAAAGHGAFMIESFVDGRLTRNGLWTRLELSPHECLEARLLEPAVETPNSCCCRFAGLGDEGIEELRNLMTGQTERRRTLQEGFDD